MKKESCFVYIYIEIGGGRDWKNNIIPSNDVGHKCSAPRWWQPCTVPKPGATTSQRERVLAQSQWTKGGRGTHWEIMAAWCHSAATWRGVLPINDRFNQPTQEDVSWRPSSTMRWDQGSNKHRAVPCTEGHLTTAPLEDEKRDTQIFGEEFSQSLFYVIKKRFECGRKVELHRKNLKNTHATSEQGQIQSEKMNNFNPF